MHGRKPIPDSHGRCNRHNLASPAAGSEFTVVVPTNRRWEVLSCAITFVTDATVATRRVKLRIRTAGGVTYDIPSAATQVAGLSVQYYFIPSARDSAAAINGVVAVPLPDRVILPEGSTLESVTENLQAGDDFTVIFVYNMEWIEQIA